MEYKEIFNHRGQAYHEAMLHCPDARKDEFLLPLEMLDLQPDSTIYDFPSGGCYLRHFLPEHLKSVKVRPLEVSVDFAAGESQYSIASWDRLPISDGSADGFLSLAALHHTKEREKFYAEVHRSLRTGGRFVIADVERGTPQDQFLNGFVHQYNSMGHQGDFLIPSDEERRINSAGFRILRNELCSYQWNFEDQDKMIHFCRGLFGLDLANNEQIREGLAPLLASQTSIQWALRFISAIKC